MAETAPWITYRPQLKVLDCTIRDGGLINNLQFSDELVRAVRKIEKSEQLERVGDRVAPQFLPAQRLRR